MRATAVLYYVFSEKTMMNKEMANRASKVIKSKIARSRLYKSLRKRQKLSPKTMKNQSANNSDQFKNLLNRFSSF